MFHTPRWLLSHLFVGLLIISFIAAGLWQVSRLGDRRDTNAAIVERIDADPLANIDLAELAPTSEEALAAIEYRPVRIVGAFDDERSLLIGNRASDGSPGFWVWTVLELDDGLGEIIVNRGFVARRVVLEQLDISSPGGSIEIEGRLRLGLSDGRLSRAGDQLSRPDPEVAADALSLDSVTDPRLYVQSTSLAAAPLQVLPPPDLSEGPHRSYAFQWFTFALIGSGGYLWTLRRIRRGDSARGDVAHRDV